MAENRGEVLFTEYGVSGPAIFDLSRAVSTGGEGLYCVLNFFPDWDLEEVLHWLHLRRQTMAAHEASTLLVGSCHTRLGQMLCKGRRLHQSAGRLPLLTMTCAASPHRPQALPCPSPAPAASIRRR